MSNKKTIDFIQEIGDLERACKEKDNLIESQKIRLDRAIMLLDQVLKVGLKMGVAIEIDSFLSWAKDGQ